MASTLDMLILLLAGAAGGFLSGMLGVGGGIIFIPILDLVLKHYGIETEPVKYILANSLTVIIFTGSLNSYRQYKAGNYFPRQVFFTAALGLMTAFAASWLIAQGDWYHKKAFNLVFILVLIPAILRMFFPSKNPKKRVGPASPLSYMGIGSITGIFSAFSGLGGGMVMIPSFVNFLQLDMKRAVSISAGVVPFLALPNAVSYMLGSPQVNISMGHIGYVVYPIVLPMIAGTLLTVPLGVRTGHRMSAHVGKIIFASFGTLVMIKLLYENLAS